MSEELEIQASKPVRAKGKAERAGEQEAARDLAQIERRLALVEKVLYDVVEEVKRAHARITRLAEAAGIKRGKI